MKSMNKAALVLLAAVATTGLGCSREPTDPSAASDRTGPIYDRPVNRAERSADQKIDQAAASAERKGETALDTMGDAAITAKIKSAFVAEPDLSAMNINVDTVDGTVTLQGSVDAPEKAQRARQIAQGVDGVKAVDSKLQVNSRS